MNKRISFIVSVVMAAVIILSAAGCAVPERSAEHLEDYVFTVRYHDNFNSLQLTDIHWNVNTSTKASMSYLDKLLKEVNGHIVETQGGVRENRPRGAHRRHVHAGQ